jgi:hypothetical protein
MDEPLEDTNRKRQTGIKGHYLLPFYQIQKCTALVLTATLWINYKTCHFSSRPLHTEEIISLILWYVFYTSIISKITFVTTWKNSYWGHELLIYFPFLWLHQCMHKGTTCSAQYKNQYYDNERIKAESFFCYYHQVLTTIYFHELYKPYLQTVFWQNKKPFQGCRLLFLNHESQFVIEDNSDIWDPVVWSVTKGPLLWSTGSSQTCCLKLRKIKNKIIWGIAYLSFDPILKQSGLYI